MVELLFKLGILIISFFIVYLFFRKHKNIFENWKFWLTWALTSIIIFIIIYSLILTFIFIKFSPNFDSRAFNVEEWNNNTDKRNELVGDLMDSKILDDKTRKEVIEFLGNKKANINGTEYIEYYISPGMGFLSLDSDTLIIYFKNDRVSEYKIISD